MIDWALDAALSNALAATVLAMVALAFGVMWRHPSWTHGLWLIVLLKFLTPPLFEIPLSISLRKQAATPVESRSVDDVMRDPVRTRSSRTDRPLVESSSSPERTAPLPAVPQVELSQTSQEDQATIQRRPVVRSSNAWRNYVVAVWLTGTLGWLALAAFRIRRFSSLLRKATPAPAEVSTEMATVAHRLSLRQTPDCRLVTGVMPPMVWALGRRPIVLVSGDLIARLSDLERASLWAHELAHLRRHDHWVRWLEILMIGIYWWHPVAWLVKRRLHRAGEESCDAMVAWSFPDQVHAYASALFKTIEFLGPSPAAVPPGAVGFGESRFLKRRFEMLLKNPIPRPLSIRLRVGLLAAALIVLPLSIRGLWAQPAATDATAEKDADREGSPTLGKRSKSNEDLEARLKRVERMLEQLVKQSQPASAAEVERQDERHAVDSPAREEGVTPATEQEDSRERTKLERMELDADRWLSEFVQSLERRLVLRQAHLNRKLAAERQVEAVQAAFDAGTVTLDLFLDAQRRLSDAEIEYYRSTLDIAGSTSDTPEGKRILLLLTLKSQQQARQRALQTWRRVRALMEQGAKGGEADKEAQAREQYFFFKGRVEETLAALAKLAKS